MFYATFRIKDRHVPYLYTSETGVSKVVFHESRKIVFRSPRKQIHYSYIMSTKNCQLENEQLRAELLKLKKELEERKHYCLVLENELGKTKGASFHSILYW